MIWICIDIKYSGNRNKIKKALQIIIYRRAKIFLAVHSHGNSTCKNITTRLSMDRGRVHWEQMG